MEPTDITIEILKGIRDEVRSVREEVRGVREELHEGLEATNDRIDRLHRRQIDDSIRLSSELVATNGALGLIVDELRQQRAPRARLDDLEHRVTALEKR